MSEKIPNYGEEAHLRAETEKEMGLLVKAFEKFVKGMNPDVVLTRDEEGAGPLNVPRYSDKIVALLFSLYLEGFKMRGEVILRRIYEG